MQNGDPEKCDSTGNSAGVRYALIQDTSKCFVCPYGERYNPISCSCELYLDYM